MSFYGTTQKCRRFRPMSAIEGNPDIRRRCAEGPGLTQSGNRDNALAARRRGSPPDEANHLSAIGSPTLAR
jgi:hypothetical protein